MFYRKQRTVDRDFFGVDLGCYQEISSLEHSFRKPLFGQFDRNIQGTSISCPSSRPVGSSVRPGDFASLRRIDVEITSY